MMDWVLWLAVGGGLAALWLSERRRRKRELRDVAMWLRDLHAGQVPRGPHHHDSPELLALGAEITHLANHIDAIRRDQTAEAANLQTILASMAEGVMVVDSKHVIRLANPSLVRILDLKTSPVGKSVLHSVREISFEEIVTASLTTDETQHVELTLAHAKPPRHLAITATGIRDAAGENAVLVISHDITRLKQLEDVRREFVANVSHELRTPLSIFQGYLENLLDYPSISQEDLLETLEILRKHSTRLNALVEDLLVLARLESRADVLCLESAEPASVLRAIAADWKLNAAKKQIELACECAPGTPVLELDTFRIEQVLNNLVDNAIKYTEPGGRVMLGCAPCAEGVEFSVADTGVGIPPQDVPHIFARFYRADKARSRQHGGTGLGLSIVKHIVQKHGGSVRAESVFGKGTTIFFTLPAQPRGAVSLPQPGREMKSAVDEDEHQPESHLVE